MPQKYDREARRAEYRQKLLDPRWQKKRLQVLERCNWMCQFCADKQSTLHVHHFWYESGKEPWEASDASLTALCADCHEYETAWAAITETRLIQVLRNSQASSQNLDELSSGFAGMELRSTVERDLLFSAVGWLLANAGEHRKLVDRYIESLAPNEPTGGPDAAP